MLLFGIYPRYDGASSEAYLAGWALSAAVEMALKAVTSRPVEPVMLRQPIPVDQLPTPALVLDRPIMDSNIQTMAKHLGHHSKGFRPHSKTHKCPEIAKQQIAAGAVGICTAKVSEAAVMANAGIGSILVTSPISTRDKAQVVNAIATEQLELLLVVDSIEGMLAMQAEIDDDTRIGLLLDLDASTGRTGIRDSDLLLRLLDDIQNDARFYFAGVQHYAGHVMHVHDFEKRRDKSMRAWERLADKFELLGQQGMRPQIVTGGGTGTFDIDVTLECLTDIQVGSYIFMDEEYRQVGGADSDRFQGFDLALTVACTAISQPQPSTITVDGGYKAFASDSVNPVCDALPDVEFRFAGDEHGVLILPSADKALGENEAARVRLGQVLEFAVPHCDPTVNLHDHYWIREADGLIHSCWPITARGCSW